MKYGLLPYPPLPKRKQEYCGRCGTTLYAKEPGYHIPMWILLAVTQDRLYTERTKLCANCLSRFKVKFRDLMPTPLARWW